ncbi:MAG: hypothetical protein JW827_10310 [Spirochaetes bacterium]|nr:hypothetical protein [Spirochaetota bacterium]
MKKGLILFCAFFLSINLMADYTFLEYGTGTRMVGSRSGVIDASSAESVVYNPALLNYGKNEIILSYYKPFGENFFTEGSEGLEGIHAYNAGFSLRTAKYNYGMNVLLLQNDGLEGYDENGLATGKFNTIESAITFGMGKNIGPFSMGMKSRIIYQKFYQDHSRSILGLGLGLVKKISDNLKIGLMFDNIVGLNLFSENISHESLAPSINTGISYTLGRLDLGLGISSDLERFFVTGKAVMSLAGWLNLISEMGNGLGQYHSQTLQSGSVRTFINGGMQINWQKTSALFLIGYRGDLGLDKSISLKLYY